jgi:phosphopantetheinyl transferase
VSDRAVTVHWRFGRAGGDGLPALADAAAWLDAAEQARAAALRVVKRREDWVTGRLNLKALVAGLAAARTGRHLSPADIHVDRRPSGAPFVRLSATAQPFGPWAPAEVMPLAVSNSHSHGHALAAAAWIDEGAPGRLAVGADLEFVEPRSDLFVADFLTRDERAYVGASEGAERHARANAVWSAKEAVLKVLQRGLTADTWWLTCVPCAGRDSTAGETTHAGPALDALPDPEAWDPFAVTCDARLETHGLALAGRWRRIEGFVASVAAGVAR